MTAIERVKAAGRANALRAALNDAEMETILEAVRIALEEKRKAMRAASEVRMSLTEVDFGIPALQSLQERFSAAYEIEVEE